MNHTFGAWLGRERVKRLLESALRHSRADETEVALVFGHNALTRFADNYIHQNVVDETPLLSVRAVFGKRVGIASTARLDEEGIIRVVEQAAVIACAAHENDRFPGLPGTAEEPAEAARSDTTAFCSPEKRADVAGDACRLARDVGLSASGSVATTGQELAVANSHGVFAYSPRSIARIVVVATGDAGSGYAEESSLDLSTLDMANLAGRAVDIGRRAQNPIEVAPGSYTVILQPEAVSDVASFLAVLGFGGRSVYEGRSFVAGKLGQRVLGENVTMWDDSRDRSGLPLPFDAEGLPRRRLSLLDRGIAGDIALDTMYGSLLGRPSTGHASWRLSFGDPGPIPTNVFIAPGESPVDEMIRSTKRGLLVTHFHYTRVVHPLHVIITGMTRDGTFLIEDGEVTRPVKNLRFTQSYLDALRDVQAIGNETQLVGDGRASRVPALKIGSFTFTGVTQ